jgi:hypothetical protein
MQSNELEKFATFSPEKIMSVAIVVSSVIQSSIVSVKTFLSFDHRSDPGEQARSHFFLVDLIEHFVSSAGVEIVGDDAFARFAIAGHQQVDAFELLAHGIFTTRKEVDGQVIAYLAKTDRVGQSGRRRQKR